MASAIPFTEDDLQRAAGPVSYTRGLGYLNQVEDLEIADTWVAATVFGTEAYEVRLGFGGDRAGVSGLLGECSCPFGMEGNFCKHCVAVGLAALKSEDQAPESGGGTASARLEWQSLVTWLASLTKDELLDELLELAENDRYLRRRLELRAAAEQADIEAVRNAVRRLLRVTDYIGGDQARDYADNVRGAADAIGDLIDAGAAGAALEVARDAIHWFRQCMDQVDDSAGYVASAGCDLLSVHLLGCQAARPDPVELADDLADLLLTDNHFLGPALTDYAELLGDAGMAALHERVAEAYAASPDDHYTRHLMGVLLEAEGDVDALIAFYATHLDGHGWQHLRIAQTLDEAGRPEEALGWAERGARSGPQPDSRLVDYLVDRYTAAGRADDVLALRRALFAADRTLAGYQALRQAATDSGVWGAERLAALDLLRKDAAKARQPSWSGWSWAGPVLIDALIDDGDLAAAWTSAGSIASEAQWVRLADASIADRPADALAVYVKAINQLTEGTGNAVYHKIAAHLLSARACHEALGTLDKFRQYLVVLKMGQKRKKNLMNILEQNGL
jgi:uncharacterized Zn finger protein